MNNLPSTSWAISPMAICQQRSKYRSVRFRPGRHSDPLRASDLASVRSHRQSLQTHPPCAAYAATGTTEQTFTLEGSLEDSKGSVGADDFVWRPGGNIHVAHAPNGAMFISVFNRPNRFFDGTKFFTSAEERGWRWRDFSQAKSVDRQAPPGPHDDGRRRSTQ
jgi:hypothetical protein